MSESSVLGVGRRDEGHRTDSLALNVLVDADGAVLIELNPLKSVHHSEKGIDASFQMKKHLRDPP